jgi:hypothetical protein
MKTTLAKIALLGIAGAIAFALSSFKANVATTHVNVTKKVVEDEWAEWNKVQAFVDENITDPIADKDKNSSGKMSAFSRCPSGYQSDILAEAKDVKTDKMIFGSIVYYRGCSPKTICDYKVCVDKNIALVKNHGAKEYMSVNEWLASKETKTNSTAQNTKKLKG